MQPRNRSLTALVAMILIALVGQAGAQGEAESGSETWYVLRGKANMKIRNYNAAIEAFAKATEINPENRDAMRELGIAYEKQGLTDKAVGQFDRYLARFEDDPEIAFKQADYLSWDRYSYRRADAIRYYRMGLTEREDRRRRHQLARLLAQDRDQLDAALEQYRILLEAEPDNSLWRAEYRDLLLWDPKNLAEAVEEYRRLAQSQPDDFEVQYTLARLVARQSPRGDEAVSMYADLVASRPGDAELRLEYAQVLARQRGRRNEALEQYRKVLASNPSFDTREEYADLLSGRKELRGEALKQYAILLKQRPDDVPVRLKYARLLGAEREDTEQAIAQYDAVLRRDSRNPEAHEGLARSYAWLDDRDRALEHANLAARSGSGDVGELRKDLLRGREPRLEPVFRGLVQRGRSRSELNGIGIGLRGQYDPSPFVTFSLEAGFEDYWRSGDNTAGGYFDVGSEFRLDPTQRIDFGLGYHSLGSNSGRNVTVKAEYARDGETLGFKVGFARTLRYDSYVGLVGDRIDGVRIGAARENRFYGRVSAERGPLEASLDPYAGWVDADGVDDNPFVGLRGRLDYTLWETNAWKVAGVLGTDLYHYDEDAFGVDPAVSSPRPGGYFSPQFFFEAVPGLSAKYQWGESAFLDLEGGPALQFVNESGGGTEFNVGGYARLSYLLFIRDSLFWSLQTGFVRIADAYTRIDWRTGLTFKF